MVDIPKKSESSYTEEQYLTAPQEETTRPEKGIEGKPVFTFDVEANEMVERNERLDRVAGKLLFERNMRRQFMAPEIFGEPAWDILLSAFLAEQDNTKPTVVGACTVCHIPFVIGFRWLKVLEKLGLMARYTVKLPNDDLLIEYARLTPVGLAAIESYLGTLVAGERGRT